MYNLKTNMLEVAYPPISTFFHIDVPLCILYGKPETHPWIFSNYIQLYSIHNLDRETNCFIDFFHSFNGAFRLLELSTCPWILLERISRKDVKDKWPSAIDFIKEKINENKYIGFTVEMSKISNYIDKIYHNLFIYGFDDERCVLYTADHFRDGIFKFEEVSYDEFSNAVLYSYDRDLDWGNLEGVCLFSIVKRTHENIYKFDLRKVIHDIKSYLLLEGFAYKHDDYYIYGIECYDNLIKAYSLILEKSTNCELKGIHTQICHKKMMELRLKYLGNNGFNVEYIAEKFNRIKSKLESTLGLTIKYNITEDKSYLEKCIENLEIIKLEEINVFHELLKLLMEHK